MTEDDVIAAHDAWLEQGGNRSPKHVQVQNLRGLIRKAIDMAWAAGYDKAGDEEAQKARIQMRKASQTSFGEGVALGAVSASLVPPKIAEVVENHVPNLDPKPEPLVDSNPQTTAAPQFE
jgi:hypothetical protein